MNKKILSFVFLLTIIVLIFIIFVAKSILRPIVTTNRVISPRGADLSKQAANVDKQSKSIKKFDVFKPEKIKEQGSQAEADADYESSKKENILLM